MKITIVSVGKMKEAYLREAAAEYQKRLSRYCRLELLEVPDEKIPEHLPEAMERKIKKTEGERLLNYVKPSDYLIALAIEGTMPDSIEFSRKIEQLGVKGESSLVFAIGGSLGLSEEVLRRAQEKISFSRLTFPHQLMRVILLEQIYRGFRILNREPYHK